MSIILKGIDLLPHCEGLIFTDHSTVLWTDDDMQIHEYEAIQIPKGHGRLIDGDELVKHLRKDPLFDLVERYGISGVIESRPTILEAET